MLHLHERYVVEWTPVRNNKWLVVMVELILSSRRCLCGEAVSPSVYENNWTPNDKLYERGVVFRCSKAVRAFLAA